jgi:hypothetical protein
MVCFKRLLCWVLTVLITVAIGVQSAIAASPQPPAPPSQSAIAASPQPPAPPSQSAIAASSQSSAPLSWNDISIKLFSLSNLQEQRYNKPGGKTPPKICLISPGRQEQIWHDRPLFIWQGTQPAIGVRQSDTGAILWQRSSPATSPLKRARYLGEELRSGRTYDWLFFAKEADSAPQFWVKFQIMPPPASILISAELKTLERKLEAAEADAETIALHRANYFAQKNLWTDVLQEIYSVREPSAELQQLTQEILTRVCQ